MVSKTIIVAVIIVVLAVGGIYVMQKPSTPTPSPMPTATPTSSPTPTAKPTVTETPTTTAAPAPTQTTTPNPTTIEEGRVQETVMAFVDAYNRRSAEDAASFFTEGAVRTVSAGGKIFKATGWYYITRQFANFFRNNPDTTLTGVDITKLSVTGDKATVQIKYTSVSPKNQISAPYTEDLELAKVGDTWKITQDVANQRAG